jgi:hypothetical protein
VEAGTKKRDVHLRGRLSRWYEAAEQPNANLGGWLGAHLVTGFNLAPDVRLVRGGPVVPLVLALSVETGTIEASNHDLLETGVWTPHPILHK